MSGKKKKKAKSVPAGMKQPETFRVRPVNVHGSFENYLEDAEKISAECKEEYLASDVRAKDFPAVCDRWAAAIRAEIMAAAALFGRRASDQKGKERALEMFQRCKDDSGIREKGLMQHYELAKKDETVSIEERRKLRGKVLESLVFYFRADGTQQSYLKRYVSDPEYVDPESKILMEQGPIAKKIRDMVPAGHHFLPARPFPPKRVPGWRNEVPYPPAPFIKWKNQPVEAFIYDEEHDEFILPEGYLSEDGTIDDQSVVFDWEKRTVTCKFVGGEPVTWPFWKPRNLSEAPKKGTWFWDYSRQLYRQVINGRKPPD